MLKNLIASGAGIGIKPRPYWETKPGELAGMGEARKLQAILGVSRAVFKTNRFGGKDEFENSVWEGPWKAQNTSKIEVRACVVRDGGRYTAAIHLKSDDGRECRLYGQQKLTMAEAIAVAERVQRSIT